MRYLLIIEILIVLFICSCSKNIERKEELIGKGIDDTSLQSNKLIYDTVYYYYKNKRLYEYQNNLCSLLSNIRDNDSVQIREMSFYCKNDIKAYVWLMECRNKWVIIDNIFFNDKKVRF